MSFHPCASQTTAPELTHKWLCRNLHTQEDDVATNLALDDALIERAKDMGGHRTKRAAVTAALEEYVGRRERLKLLDLFGTIDYDDDYDYKAERSRSTPE